MLGIKIIIAVRSPDTVGNMMVGIVIFCFDRIKYITNDITNVIKNIGIVAFSFLLLFFFIVKISPPVITPTNRNIV